ncbi:hypothetical protein AL714_01655 [Clostridium botulinum]|uniref:hypothetical protein n=1 Tax=Clostridium botulinum TaxID=1491 RepID=UPI000773E000|nr:hypothetical protein [Clostridium botulinum]OPD30078.1 hypothetical protein AL713_14140 [Clostridium botulinum]OPD38780.1 hypothetical protein AL714_01655 [Clostridium botulinum]
MKKNLSIFFLAIGIFFLNITPVSASGCNGYINWEQEPNNLMSKEETNYLIPYSYCRGTVNKGYLPAGDIDVWNFDAIKKNYKVSFRAPEGYYYDLVIWQRFSDGHLEEVVRTDSLDQVKEIDLPGRTGRDGELIKEYLVVVHSKWTTNRDADEPYTLVLLDKE